MVSEKVQRVQNRICYDTPFNISMLALLTLTFIFTVTFQLLILDKLK